MSHSTQTNLETVLCPYGHGKMELEKSWKVTGKGGGGFTMQLWRCRKCRASLRKAKKGVVEIGEIERGK